MKRFVLLVLFAVLCVICTSQGRVPNTKRTLVVIDSGDVKNTHSQFFAQLKSKGYQLDYYLTAQSSSIKLSQHGEYNYDHLIILASKAPTLGPLDSKSISKFVDDGNNVMIVADGSLSKLLREVGSDSGAQFDDDNTRAIDHFTYDTKLDNGKHNVLVLDQEYEFSSRPSVISNRRQFTQAPVLFNGMAISLKGSNPLLLPILTGSGTSYSHNGGEAMQAEPLVRGQKTVLVGGLQARNGARITFVGSKDMLSNKYFESVVTKSGSQTSLQSGNAAFAQELIQWSFQERGILRHRNVFHYKKGDDTVQPHEYRVADDSIYTVIIEEWVEDKWVPFVADDIQVDLIMLHPYVRTALKYVSNGKYEAHIRVPDVYGCFKFKVDFRRSGYSSLIFEDNITIRPTRINEFERFIPAAYPYYISVFSCMAGFLIFIIAFLFTGDKVKKD